MRKNFKILNEIKNAETCLAQAKLLLYNSENGKEVEKIDRKAFFYWISQARHSIRRNELTRILNE